MQRTLIWHRYNLRLRDRHDLQHLQKLQTSHSQLIPLYCFDPRDFGKTAFGFPKTGAYRSQFLRESVANLRENLRQQGSDLIIRQGKPEQIIPELVKTLNIDQVCFEASLTREEQQVEQALRHALQPLRTHIQTHWGASLYHPSQLPFEIEQLPDVFSQFRKAVEKSASIPPPVAPLTQFPPLPEMDVGELPSLASLGVDSPQTDSPQTDSRSVLAFQGGESAGMQRLHDYIWRGDCLRNYKLTRNGMLGADYSSKFSPWLALGCLSPRSIVAEVQRYEQERVANQSTYWLVFELLWRDYFRLVAAKYRDRLFYKSGLQKRLIDWQQDWQLFDSWRSGMTGYPLVDANMRELAATGFMSNRGRQNVASFLTKNLGIDWRMGAEWFESLLIDYDVCSNWGNWTYTAGVGNDARGFRYFNIPKQSQDYDPNGDYLKYWLPELAAVPGDRIHQIHRLNAAELQNYGVKRGVDYPPPVVDLAESLAVNQQRYESAIALQ
ncbi:MAG: deoxyribodipyrimidine photo-lyase [Phormidium sp. OSCR]|nr:MAG: deoxyribodipyrimidine photo-lyase [Phormidium sp. OSCR]